MTSNMLPLGRGPTICRKFARSLAHQWFHAQSFYRVGKEGSKHQAWERATWPALKELCEKYPDAGIHFRGMI